MRSSTSIALLAAAAAGIVRAQSTNDTIECVDGLYMIVARGTGEDAGTGETGKVTDKILERIDNSTAVGLDYPASFNGEVGDNNYFQSVEAGYENMKEAIEKYYDACPDGLMAVFGYSQGAQISSDAICGGSGGWFNDGAEPIDIEIIEKNIVSIVLFGDPSYVKDASYSRGTGKKDGIFEREDESSARCNEIAERVVSYCDEGDYYCGPDIFNIDSEIHTEYVNNYGDDVVELVVAAYNDFTPEFSSGRSSLAEVSDNSTTSGSDRKDDDEGAAATLIPSFYFVPLLAMGLWQLL